MVATIDELSGRKLLSPGQLQWLYDHDELLMQWADANLAEFDDELMFYMNTKDEIFRFILYQIMKQRSDFVNPGQKLKAITDRIGRNPDHIMLIAGNRGSGKTTIAMQICYDLNKYYNRRICWFGPPAVLPSFITDTTLDIKKIPTGALTIMDEASLQFYNKMSMEAEQTDVMRMLPVIRHSGRGFIIITQSPAIINMSPPSKCG